MAESNLFRKSIFYGIIAIALILNSCTKTETITTHENLIVSGNTPPDANGVSTVQLKNYINNLFIDLFGRGPTQDELDNASTILIDGAYSYASRENLIEEMMSQYEYYKNIQVLTSQKMLVDVDSITISYEIDLYEYLIELSILSGDSLFIFYYENELSKLEELLAAPLSLSSGEIGISAYFRRFLNNNFYDQVNMGSLNFVVSCFENLLQRNPTDEELDDGILMVDGNPSQLFLVDGNSKQQFMDIITSIAEFYEGQVEEAFLVYIRREPDSYEMQYFTEIMMEDDHFNTVKTEILKSKEYAGF